MRSVGQMLFTAITTNPVFVRFAKLSDEDKAKVVEKVKERLREKTEDGEQEEEHGNEQESVSETELSEDNVGSGQSGEPEGEPPVIDDSKSPEDTEGDVADESPEVEFEEMSESESGTDEMPVESPVDAKQGELRGIVDGLAKELDEIREDGHIDSSEVVTLLSSMMEMVSMLLEARLPRRRRRKKSRKAALDAIAKRVAAEFEESLDNDFRW